MRLPEDLKLTDAQRAEMDRMHEQMRGHMGQMHSDLHRQVVAQLSAEHRALLAAVAGNVATGSIATVRDGAKQLDDALSNQEKRNVVKAAESCRAQMRDAMLMQHKKFEAVLTPQQRSQLEAEHAKHEPMPGMEEAMEHHASDPGMVLLEVGFMR
jgi:hypothetical protein